MGTGGSFPGLKRPGREADHSPPSNAEATTTLLFPCSTEDGAKRKRKALWKRNPSLFLEIVYNQKIIFNELSCNITG
jgi:hypothetical protein